MEWADAVYPFQLTAARRRLGLAVCNQRPSESFNSQPPEGGWQLYRRKNPDQNCFNSQPPEGGWDSQVASMRSNDVSTHSRPKAAGWLRRKQVIWHGSFNSQPPEGGWSLMIPKAFLNFGFNSQPPEGGWPVKIRIEYYAEPFQLTAARRRLVMVHD